MQNAKGEWTMKNGKVRRRKGPTMTKSKQQHKQLFPSNAHIM